MKSHTTNVSRNYVENTKKYLQDKETDALIVGIKTVYLLLQNSIKVYPKAVKLFS